MREIDPGHVYELTVYDGMGSQALVFVKREGPGYPGNVGSHAGTNCQEVIRALIARVKYLEGQIAHPENGVILGCLREALMAFERRAAERHGRKLPELAWPVEQERPCRTCGHIHCDRHE